MSNAVMSKFDRLESFLDKLKSDLYPEPESQVSVLFTEEGIKSINHMMRAGDKVLDIGCGRGLALDKFRDLGANVTGITLSEEDARVARFNGHDVRIMDMSFLEFEDEYFDGIWARHSLEHSIFPFYTLYEWKRILKPGGWFYIEVPAPNAPVDLHEINYNHYSVLGLEMLASLIKRSGFNQFDAMQLDFTTERGADIYYRIIGRKIETVS